MMVQPDNSVLQHFDVDNNNEYDTNANDIDRKEGALIDISYEQWCDWFKYI